jgi:hypothetical protein
MTVETTPQLLPVREWAKIAGFSKIELYRRSQNGKLSARLVNGVMRIHRDDMVAMIGALLPRVGE